MKKAALSVFAILSAMSTFTCYGDQQKDYDLAERCGKRALQLWKSEYQGQTVLNTKDGQAIQGYTNHYNSKLNKCLVITNYEDIPYKKKIKGQVPSSTQSELWDINENRMIGSFFKNSEGFIMCNIDDKKCASEKEWELLIKPYMTE